MISNSTTDTNPTLAPDTNGGQTTLLTQKTVVLEGDLVQSTPTDQDPELPIPATTLSPAPALSTTFSADASVIETIAPATSSSLHIDHLNENNKRLISLTAQWNGKKLPFEVDLDYTIGELKNKLTFLMMGTPEAKVIKAPETLPDVLNDLEEDYTPDDEAFASMAQNQKNLKATIAKCKIDIMNPLRSGKKLLVLDLDYTLIDCKALNNPLIDVMRPGLHDFLAVCYEHYDIVIWSQTSWRALEAKVTTIGLLTHPDYKISFVMDISTMFSVMSQRDGKPFKHQVKALDIIWSKFPQYNARNTIHIDDLSRNFAMNPRSGLKIGAFKNGAISRHTDRELYHLARYLVEISKANDFKELDHKSWKNHRRANP
ncbi:hypothetical protein BGZ80_003396 [Entomortierella chlamydospora]|uniref:FCP1 homology domain-containing protein n=1 Tax=Entomortierella chlamydospora TaxID=101097 RepID=A0A9P6SWZ1_9FUNG|nr:hypothetical protein BGZ80_003396 [Entomortierella chlamydospora]